MAVEKVTVQQAAGDLLKDKIQESPAETYSFNSSNINPFEAAASGITKSIPAQNPKNELLFGSKIIEEPKSKEVKFEVPQSKNQGTLSALSNYLKNVKYGIYQFDAASAPNVKKALSYLPDRDSLYAAVDSNKRIAAILIEAGLLQQA